MYEKKSRQREGTLSSSASPRFIRTPIRGFHQKKERNDQGCEATSLESLEI